MSPFRAGVKMWVKLKGENEGHNFLIFGVESEISIKINKWIQKQLRPIQELR
jgi:hypothetical protein